MIDTEITVITMAVVETVTATEVVEQVRIMEATITIGSMEEVATMNLVLTNDGELVVAKLLQMILIVLI